MHRTIQNRKKRGLAKFGCAHGPQGPPISMEVLGWCAGPGFAVIRPWGAPWFDLGVNGLCKFGCARARIIFIYLFFLGGMVKKNTMPTKRKSGRRQSGCARAPQPINHRPLPLGHLAGHSLEGCSWHISAPSGACGPFLGPHEGDVDLDLGCAQASTVHAPLKGPLDDSVNHIRGISNLRPSLCVCSL